MLKKSTTLLLTLAALGGLAGSANAGLFTKDANTSALNTTASWFGGVLAAPGASDTVVWDSKVTAANTVALGGSVAWGGIQITNPGGAVIVTHAAGNVLTLGGGGINMTAATQNLTLLNSANIAGNIAIGANQTWNVASGRTLQLFSNSNAQNQRLTGSGNIEITGGGIVRVLTGDAGSTTFVAGNGNDTYSGNWTITNGVVKGLRNGTHAWGTGTIYMNGGTLGQEQGGWLWSNNIVLNTGTTSTFDDFNSSGLTRALKLQGVISGSGNLNIIDTSSRMDANTGFILTGSNTMSGTITIGASGNLRVGGITGNDIGVGAGTGGTLGTASINLNAATATLTFSRSDAHTVANTIYGTGMVNVGGTVASAGTQVLTLSGTNTYTGATTVAQGRLNLTGSLTSAITVAGVGKIGGNGSTTGLLTLSSGAGLVLAGGATTTGLTVNGATFSGSNAVTFDTDPFASTVYDVFTYGSGTVTNPGNLSVAWRGALSNDSTNQKYIFTAGAAGTRTWNTTTGTWATGTGTNFVEGDQMFYGGDSVVFNNPASVSVITLSGSLVPASVIVDNTIGYSFAGSGSIAGSGTLTKRGVGTLTLSNTNTLSGATTVSNGTLLLANSSALGTSAVTINDASTGANNTSMLIDASVASITIARPITVANQGSGVTTIGSSALGSGLQAIFSGAITLAKDVTLSAATGGDRTQFSGGIGGTGNVTVTSAGTGRVLFLTTANTFSGNLNISDNSTLQLSDGTATVVSLIPDASTVTVGAGAILSLAKNGNSETIDGLSGSGTVQATAGTNTLIVGNNNATTTFSGTLKNNGGVLALTKAGSGTLTLNGTLSYTGVTTVSAGTLVLSGNHTLGSGLANALGETTAAVDFGANTLTIGNATAGNTGAYYYGKLIGTGTILLRGGSQTIQNSDGTGSTSGNYELFMTTTATMPTGAFALDTGASVTDRKDFAFINDTDDVLTLSSLTGYGAIRNDANGTPGSTVTRHITVDQSSGDTTFNGALLSHRSSAAAIRALTFEKKGTSALTLAGFIGKETAAAGAGSSPVNLIANGGILDVTNASNTTTANTGAIGLGTVTVTSGTLGFANQALINTAGSAGATSILMNGGTLRWDTGNTQDITAGGRLTLVADKAATFDTNGNDVTLATALGGGAINASITKSGAGILTISGSNSYSGGTTVTAGTLTAGAVHAFGTGAVTVNGGTLDLNSQGVGNAITLAGGTVAGSTGYTGTVTATGGSTLTGSIGGTFVVGAGQTVEAAGATFNRVQGTGTINGAATITTAAPGNSTGVLTFDGNKTIVAYEWELENATASAAGAGAFDGITLTGGILTIDSVVAKQFNLTNWDPNASYSWTIATATGGITGALALDATAFAAVSAPGATWSLSTATGGTSLVLTYVPEPGTLGLLAIGALALLGRRRNRRG